MKITDALFAEHVVFHHIFDHVESSTSELKSLGEIKCVARMIERLLSAHTRTEDELFIGPLEHCFEQIGQRETFHKEHQQIEHNLELIQTSKRAAQARALLHATAVACRKHFDKEERIVFPMAERCLSSKTLEALAQSWREQRQMPDRPKRK